MYICPSGSLIINITEPKLPSPVANITDGTEYLMLDGPRAITTVTLGPFTYALVTAFVDNGVQIINITDPASPSPVTSITYNKADYTKLSGAYGIATTTINSSLYALVASYHTGMQIIGLDHGFISAYTSNQNPKYAKAGDTLIINFNASGTIASHTSQILGLDATATVNGAVYNATVTVPSTPRESYATFMINVTNTQGTNATITENDISLSNVFIDTISPSIELIGSADYTILPGAPSSSIPNVIVSDGDPNYVENFTLVKNATVNTTIIGSVYNYTYTANTDPAGNLGSSTSRIITVMEPLFEIRPNLVASPAGTIQNGKNGFYSIVNPGSIGTFKIGNSVYAGVTAAKINGDNNFTVVNITDPNSPSLVYVLNRTTTNPSFIIDTAYTVIDGSTYMIPTRLNQLAFILNVSNPSLPSFVEYLPNGGTRFSPYGITTITIGTSIFALTASLHNVLIINITDPSDPVLTSTITHGVDYLELVYPQFLTTVAIDSSTFVLVTSNYDNSVQIIDITDPYNPTPASALTDDGGYAILTVARSITTVAIDSSTFVLAASNRNNSVQIIDITDPYNPTPVSTITEDDDYTTLGGAQSIHTATFGASTFALVAASYDNGVQIIDITDPYNPAPVSAITDGVDGYTELNHAYFITTVTIGSSTYALVASFEDNSIQM